jgi:glutamine synthetase
MAFAAMLMAGLDGIQNKIDPGAALEHDIFEMTEGEKVGVPQVPGSLAEALAALKEDNEFLLKGGVFTEDVIDVWTQYKQENEIDALALRPHPYEFYLYFDI